MRNTDQLKEFGDLALSTDCAKLSITKSIGIVSIDILRPDREGDWVSMETIMFSLPELFVFSKIIEGFLERNEVEGKV